MCEVVVHAPSEAERLPKPADDAETRLPARLSPCLQPRVAGVAVDHPVMDVACIVGR